MKVPWISKDQISEKAQNLIKNFQAMLGYTIKPPIPVEDIIDRYLGLRLAYDDLEKVLGMKDVLGATWVKSRLICINEKLFEQSSEGRLVFTCAHEIGHWILHRQYVSVQERLASKVGAFVCRAKDAKEPIEWQADYFAACLLMPEKDTREAFHKVCGAKEIVLKNVRSSNGSESLGVEPCVDHWLYIAAATSEAGGFSNVSKQAMVIRLQDLGLLINLTGKQMSWDVLCSNA
jgi:Zn-dependent peptidase ImmA (M78 family)